MLPHMLGFFASVSDVTCPSFYGVFFSNAIFFFVWIWMANILQMLSKESIVEMKKKTQVEFCDFDFSSYTYFYKC